MLLLLLLLFITVAILHGLDVFSDKVCANFWLVLVQDMTRAMTEKLFSQVLSASLLFNDMKPNLIIIVISLR